MTTVSKTYYACPCTNSTGASGESQDDAEDDHSFDPSDPRANYALYPLENLLFCNECHEIRCPRCYYEEALYYFCPSCLLETQSSTVKIETNRCTRSCFQCPLCTAPLSINSFQTAEEARITTDNPAKKDGPFILNCSYCGWSTLEIGIRFEKSINLSAQLAKLPNGSDLGLHSGSDEKAVESSFEDVVAAANESTSSDHYSRLASFYRNQLADTTNNAPGTAGAISSFDSPTQLSRLLSSYGVGGLKKQKGKVPIMREPMGRDEGLEYEVDAETEDLMIDRMADLGWDDMTDIAQRATQPNRARFFPDLRPIATRLRSKRAKRCRTCRNNLIRPEDKRQSTRYKIRLLALNYIPGISITPLNAGDDISSLVAGKVTHFKLTFHNPLFDAIGITLATSRITPGPVASRVTILCPQFEVGASSDAWDEALDASKRRTVQGSVADGHQPEAGKVWERGRNWTSVVLEIVPGAAPAGVETSAKLEVSIFVRMEYETDDTTAGGYGEGKAGKDKRVKRELAWWTVVRAGDIAQVRT